MEVRNEDLSLKIWYFNRHAHSKIIVIDVHLFVPAFHFFLLLLQWLLLYFKIFIVSISIIPYVAFCSQLILKTAKLDI